MRIYAEADLAQVYSSSRLNLQSSMFHCAVLNHDSQDSHEILLVTESQIGSAFVLGLGASQAPPMPPQGPGKETLEMVFMGQRAALPDLTYT